MNNYVVKENELLFAKVRPDAIIPSKEDANAGYDLYANFEEDFMVIPSNSTRLIPTGIASALNPKYYAQIEERGSTGSKGIKKSCGVIDSNYRGEWFIAITNTNSEEVVITKLTIDELIVKYGKEEDDWGADDNTILVYGDEGAGEYAYLKYARDAQVKTIFYPYSKAIAQAVIHEVPVLVVSEIDYEDLKAIPSERGIGKLGSSNK